ncbi:MAG: NUDIX hydrolase [Candidatus Thorarchaeota archaeon]|jgi:ADP-ribose pyrophosphatase YjhB (NUDIX family)
MKPTKISFDTDVGTFGVRAEGVMLKGNQVLLHQPETFDFWTFPGGGVHFDETLQEALDREWFEETGFQVEVKRLLYIIENFFEFKGNDIFPTIPPKDRVHGYGFCFLVEPTENEGVWLEEEFYGQEDIEYQGRDLRITFRWFSRNELDSINLVPLCLKEALKTIPDYPVHIVDRDV